jgi:hypothetical protein
VKGQKENKTFREGTTKHKSVFLEDFSVKTIRTSCKLTKISCVSRSAVDNADDNVIVVLDQDL